VSTFFTKLHLKIKHRKFIYLYLYLIIVIHIFTYKNFSLFVEAAVLEPAAARKAEIAGSGAQPAPTEFPRQ
jgi:hypothetical protein